MTMPVMVYDGTKWVSPGGAAKDPDVQDFTSSGTWTKPDGARLVKAELIAAGGGCAVNGATYMSGGGGEYVQLLMDAADLGATESVTIGAGGSSVSGTNIAGNGGSTTFGGASATGGGGGSTNPNGPGAGGGGNILQFDGSQSNPRAAGGAGGNGGWGSNSTAGSSERGAGGGAGKAGGHGSGGTEASAFGLLQAGNGGEPSFAATAPGGGSGGNGNGASGGARITTYF